VHLEKLLRQSEEMNSATFLKEMNMYETLWPFVAEDIAFLLKLDVVTPEGNEK
jgi:hypothetical protein